MCTHLNSCRHEHTCAVGLYVYVHGMVDDNTWGTSKLEDMQRFESYGIMSNSQFRASKSKHTLRVGERLEMKVLSCKYLQKRRKDYHWQ